MLWVGWRFQDKNEQLKDHVQHEQRLQTQLDALTVTKHYRIECVVATLGETGTTKGGTTHQSHQATGENAQATTIRRLLSRRMADVG